MTQVADVPSPQVANGRAQAQSFSGVDDLRQSSAQQSTSKGSPLLPIAPIARQDVVPERRNWLIHELYVRKEYSTCLALIETQLRETGGLCEYALYVKGLLLRMEGSLTESFRLLQAAVAVSPDNAANRKQLGRALFLLGKHREAIDAFREAESVRAAKGAGDDWELLSCIGACYVYLHDYPKAVEAFTQSLALQRHDATYLQLGQVLVLQGEYQTAVEVYELALSFSPGNAEILTLLGQLYLKQGVRGRAFDCLGQCLTIDYTNSSAMMAAASMIQDAGDYDVALNKYRVAVQYIPDSAQLWNNIGACFFGKKHYYAAVASLRKSIFLSPLEWITNYNLGIVYLAMRRSVSAYRFLTSAISLHADYAPAYMLLGICLSLLNDIENARQAYNKAREMGSDFLVDLNYAITLFNSGLLDEATAQFSCVQRVWDRWTPEMRHEQPMSVPVTLRMLSTALAAASSPSAAEPHAPTAVAQQQNSVGPSSPIYNDQLHQHHSSSSMVGEVPAAAAELPVQTPERQSPTLRPVPSPTNALRSRPSQHRSDSSNDLTMREDSPEEKALPPDHVAARDDEDTHLRTLTDDCTIRSDPRSPWYNTFDGSPATRTVFASNALSAMGEVNQLPPPSNPIDMPTQDELVPVDAPHAEALRFPQHNTSAEEEVPVDVEGASVEEVVNDPQQPPLPVPVDAQDLTAEDHYSPSVSGPSGASLSE